MEVVQDTLIHVRELMQTAADWYSRESRMKSSTFPYSTIVWGTYALLLSEPRRRVKEWTDVLCYRLVLTSSSFTLLQWTVKSPDDTQKSKQTHNSLLHFRRKLSHPHFFTSHNFSLFCCYHQLLLLLNFCSRRFLNRAPSCRSVIEIIDVTPNGHKKTLFKVCSPSTRKARNELGSFIPYQTYFSSGNQLQIILRRAAQQHDATDVEFIDGAYMFHNSEQSGTLQSYTLCDTHHYGLSSPEFGSLDGPGSQHLFWNIEGTLNCTHSFIPAANQSVSVTIDMLDRLGSDAECQTVCKLCWSDVRASRLFLKVIKTFFSFSFLSLSLILLLKGGDAGCQCLTGMNSIENIDHLIMTTEDGQFLNCLCGNFQQEWLPVSLRSWTPIKLVYSIAKYSWSTKGFTYKASYNFITDGMCGQKTFTTQSGEIHSRNFSQAFALNSFYHQQCIWILDSNIERQLVIEVGWAENTTHLLPALFEKKNKFSSNSPTLSSKQLWQLQKVFLSLSFLPFFHMPNSDHFESEPQLYGMECLPARVLAGGRWEFTLWTGPTSVLSPGQAQAVCAAMESQNARHQGAGDDSNGTNLHAQVEVISYAPEDSESYASTECRVQIGRQSSLTDSSRNHFNLQLLNSWQINWVGELCVCRFFSPFSLTSLCWADASKSLSGFSLLPHHPLESSKLSLFVSWS